MAALYSVAVNPVDGTIWGTSLGFPGYVVRLNPGPDPSRTALVDGKFVNLRVRYPAGYYTKWMDGRIDDPSAGWKGTGLWSTFSTRAMVHVEGGKGTRLKVVKFQLRRDPLAR